MSISNTLGEAPDWMQLPSDFTIPEARVKREPRAVDFTVLDESQMMIAEQYMEYIEGNSKWAILVITGYAGTDKTFLVSRLLEWTIYTKKKMVACTAPTNKAV